MSFGTFKCKWVSIGRTEHCGHSCTKEFCGMHALRMRKGHVNHTCSVCGIGIRGQYGLCKDHGRDKERKKLYNEKQIAFISECRRLNRIFKYGM